jgi:hypothetical protein
MHVASNVRRRRHSERLRLLAEDDVPGRRQLRNDPRWLRRRRELRTRMHVASNMRRRRHSQRLRLHAGDDVSCGR